MSDFFNKRIWKYRGKRIRPYMRNNVKLAGAIIFVPVFLLSMFIFWREQLIHFDLSQVIKHFECYPFVFVDCLYTTIRNDYETKKYAVYTILGYTIEGKKDIL
ncbi:transposase, partial [Bacillus subtilis]|uniref:transposase n=1 Tax=Bacillus subtilis TaxID=1423 RepID=UPI0039EF1389